MCSVAAIRHEEWLLKNRGNDNHSNVTHLGKIRTDKGFSIADVCRQTGLSYDNYIKYERGEVKEQYMNLETLQKLSDLFGVNLENKYHTFKRNSSFVVRKYMKDNNLSIRHFAKQIDVSATTIKNWLNGKCAPSYSKWQTYFKDYKI